MKSLQQVSNDRNYQFSEDLRINEAIEGGSLINGKQWLVIRIKSDPTISLELPFSVYYLSKSKITTWIDIRKSFFLCLLHLSLLVTVVNNKTEQTVRYCIAHSSPIIRWLMHYIWIQNINIVHSDIKIYTSQISHN